MPDAAAGTTYQGLLALARSQGAVGGANRGACKVCGQLGHLTKQCHNHLSVFFDRGSGVATAARLPLPAVAEGTRDDNLSLSSSDDSDSDSSSSSGSSEEARRKQREKERKRKRKERRRSKTEEEAGLQTQKAQEGEDFLAALASDQRHTVKLNRCNRHGFQLLFQVGYCSCCALDIHYVRHTECQSNWLPCSLALP